MNIKSITIRILPIVLAAFFAGGGCAHEAEDLSSMAVTTAAFRVVDGAVEFEDQAAFVALMRDLKAPAGGDNLFEENLRLLSSLGPERFAPLTPVYAYEDDRAIEAFTDRKLSALAAEHPGLSTTQLAAVDIDDEDQLIADPHFAALLNADRELVVGDTRYKYTRDGVFMAPKNAVQQLRSAAGNFRPNPGVYNREAHYDLGGGVGYFPQQYSSQDHISTTVAPLVAPAMQAPSAQFLRPDDCMQQMAPVAGDDLRAREIMPIDGGCGGGGSGGGSGGSGGSGGGSAGPPKQPAISSFPVCTGLRKSIWNKIFGPSAVCTQNWETRKRIKTKVWNQNYFLYSSIGISVRSQSRKLRIWWAKKTDELVLGYNTVTFDYPWSANAPLNPAMFPPANHYTYYYKGQTVNQYGGWVNTGGKIWDTGAFPITTVNDNWLEVQVY
ncbi:MAG: hypothetical protein RIF32_02915, partial [Leptospirales bacterium]